MFFWFLLFYWFVWCCGFLGCFGLDLLLDFGFLGFGCIGFGFVGYLDRLGNEGMARTCS